ncbi:MAG: LPS export ABC transporter permease LptG [Cellvibrionaceae bacterium]|nr:LPS export ABC transporter permease LptG [Cellvibrionaceae bacterium]
MRRIDRYIFTTVFSAVLLVLLLICALDMLSKLIDELGNLAGAYTFSEALIHAALLLPVSLYRYMPFAALVGSLVGLGALATNSELTAMRAAGVSLWRVTQAVLQPIALMIVLALLLAEYVVPTAEHYADSRRALKLDGVHSAQASRGGLWNREGTEFMHFNSVQANGRLLGVTRYQFNAANELVASSFSRAATYVDGYWLEEGVRETQMADRQLEQKAFVVRPWDVELSPALLAILVQDTDNLAISKLYHYIAYLRQQSIDSARYELAFWGKVLQPLAIVSLVLIALSFVFGSLREVTMGYRIFVGVVVGLSFQMAQKLLGPTSLVYGFPPFIAVAAPIGLCLLVGLFLLFSKR